MLYWNNHLPCLRPICRENLYTRLENAGQILLKLFHLIPDFCKYLENWPITEDINVYLVYSVWKVKIAFRSFW